MRLKVLMLLAVLVVGIFAYYLFLNKPVPSQNTVIPETPTPSVTESISPTVYPDTKSAITAFLVNKYKKPLSEVKVTVDNEVPGYASGTVMFGEGGPGEAGAWLAVLGNGWNVVWDGNGNVDCTKMRQDYGFPDTILKPNFCN